MTVLRRLVFGNWPLKLAALGLATVLYAGVALSESTRTWEGPVPIEVLRAPAGGALLEAPGVVDEIRFRAPQEVADQLTAGSFRASIDLSALEPRVGAEPVPVTVDVFPADPRVRVVDHSPRSVNVRLDQVVSRGLPVTIDTGIVPEDISLGPVIATPNRVSVRGASSRVQNVRNVVGRVVVDASGINIDQDVALEAYDEQGALVAGVQLEPESVRVSADVARQLAFATLPVVPELTGQPAPGKRIANVSVVPAAVTVSGENPAVRQLSAIPTEPVDVSGQEVELITEVPLDFPEEVTAPGDASVTVMVTFTDQVASRSYQVGTALVGTRPDRTYRIVDPSITVVVAGTQAQLDALDVGEVVVDVPVADLDVGDHAVSPSVGLPRGLSVARLEPDAVRVTVGQPT